MSESKSLPPAPERTDLGEILIRRGWLQRPQLEECLKLQRIVSTARPGEAAPRIGELLVQKGYVTPDLISQALKEQSRKTLLCPRCNILVNVDIRPDVVGYKCARCKSPLVENNASDAHEPCLESSVIVTSTLPVPSEVRAAEEDTTNRFGKYVLMGEIGRGGTSIVYRAWDSFLHQYVALKRVKPVLGTNKAEERRNRIQSLMTEAHNAIRLRHPNIVAVYDIARTEDDFYMSMELLEGATLGQHMRLCRERGGKSPYHEDPRKWLSVLYQAAHAIHYAHTRPVPVLHLDIKPANIFVTLEDRACVLDFGLARQLSALDGQPQAVAGTPSYMAPEQARGDSHKLDPRTDVYGLGAVLYELLSGRAPFMGDLHEVLRKAIEERPVPPSQLDGRRGRQVLGDTTLRLKFIPPELEALCLRCLEKDPSRRPTTALEFAKELASIVKGTAKPIQGI
ncbi:MAG: protein kinase, partial [Planctomycetes bacterium]|nr:protein kinase [Planctomycetota bacterium]